ncbi:hypothetical protein TorRG33x02_122280 [Trema orientale]|uniref:Reverse transcriptase domain-containing protein n=1 Tax=Trema orientale TaxID=63057 RepID=A0A2P5F272_TREOI|nr:hypothetical protein TorRG33x02_122280 [Trema orientale]
MSLMVNNSRTGPKYSKFPSQDNSNKVKIPSFDGSFEIEEFLDWIQRVDKYFEYVDEEPPKQCSRLFVHDNLEGFEIEDKLDDSELLAQEENNCMVENSEVELENEKLEEMECSRLVYMLLGKETSFEVAILEEAKTLTEKFSDMFPMELPDELPPLQDIQYQIDLKPNIVIESDHKSLIIQSEAFQPFFDVLNF